VKVAAALMLPLGGFLCGIALASVEARVIATDPAGDLVTLGVSEIMNVRIGCASSTPIRIWARPFFNGNEVSAMSNPSVLHQGSGEALGWFSFTAPAQVDEVRIRAGDGSRSGTGIVASVPIRITVGGAGPAPRIRPDWVNELQAQDRAATRDAYAKSVASPPSTTEWALMGLFVRRRNAGRAALSWRGKRAFV
jgi:hypothetical protein